jgi:hypothetical protein
MIHNCKKTCSGSERRNWTRTRLVFLQVHPEPEESTGEADKLRTGRSDIRRRNRRRWIHKTPIYYNISYLCTKRRPLPCRIVEAGEEEETEVGEEEETEAAAEAALYTGRSDIRRRNRRRWFHNGPIYYNISYLCTKRRPLPPRIVADPDPEAVEAEDPMQLEQHRPKLLLQLLEGPSSSLKFLWKRLNSRYCKRDKASWLGNSDQRDEAQQQLYFTQKKKPQEINQQLKLYFTMCCYPLYISSPIESSAVSSSKMCTLLVTVNCSIDWLCS